MVVVVLVERLRWRYICGGMVVEVVMMMACLTVVSFHFLLMCFGGGSYDRV